MFQSLSFYFDYSMVFLIDPREISNDKITASKMMVSKEKNSVINTESSYKGGKLSETIKTEYKDSEYNNDNSTIDQLKRHLKLSKELIRSYKKR